MSLAISCTPRSLLFVLGSWWSWCEETLSVLAVHRARTWADCIYSAVSRSASWINHRLRLSLLSAGAAKWVMRVFISFYPSLHGAIACDVARGSCCCCSCGRATAVVASRACGNISLHALSSRRCVEQLLPHPWNRTSSRSSACRSCRIHQPTTSRCCISYLMPAYNAPACL